MAESAAQVRYRAEFIASYERRETLVRKTVTTEAEVNGSAVTFLVAGSGNASAVTRGLNGLIPARASDLTQYTATLVEWHDLTRRTRFNIYTSQGDGRRIMQEDAIAVLNRKIDDDIITTLNTATQDNGAAVTASLNLVLHGLTVLGNNNVPLDGNISALITPAFYAYLLQADEFTNVEYINNKPFTSQLRAFTWAGINFIVHSGLPGLATAAEKCFLYHKSAVGHGSDISTVSVAVGYDEEQDYSFARSSGFMATTLLQNSGVFVMNHDGSGFAAL